VNCPLCRSTATRPGRRYHSTFIDASYALQLCGDCDSAFFDAAETPSDLTRIYDEWTEATVGDYAEAAPDSPYWRSQVATLRRLAGGPVHSVLDIGCRSGDFLMHWRAGEDRVGVELSRHAIDVARRRGLTVMQGFVEDIRFERAFNVVACYAVVEHLREPEPFLRRLPLLLEPGGVLVIMVPTRQCAKRALLDALGVRWHMYSPPQHLTFPSRGALDAILAGQGLQLAKRMYTSGGLFNPVRWVPRVNGIFDKIMRQLDYSSALNRVPIFDHMYSFYRKR
jgi:SAM-dependent methyltransferase